MLPFDRLVLAMDAWAKEHENAEVFGQIGETTLRPSNFNFSAMMSPTEYKQCFAACDLVVSHVGMGTVMAASEFGKPLIMLPRRPELHEATSSHQLDSAQWLREQPGICIVDYEDELADAISKSIESGLVPNIETETRDKLISAIYQFVSN